MNMNIAMFYYSTLVVVHNTAFMFKNYVDLTLNPMLNITNNVNKIKQDKNVFAEATMPFYPAFTRLSCSFILTRIQVLHIASAVLYQVGYQASLLCKKCHMKLPVWCKQQNVVVFKSCTMVKVMKSVLCKELCENTYLLIDNLPL